MNPYTLTHPEALADLLPQGPPVFDLQRKYLWSGTFLKTDWDFSSAPVATGPGGAGIPGAQWSSYRYLNPTIMIPNMEYISSLIKVVEQPQQGILTEDRKLGPLTVQVPTSISLDPFEVQFVEETLGSVEYFFRNFFLEMTGGASLTFKALKKLSFSFLFTRNSSSPFGVDLPNNVYFYPHVLPVEYRVDPWDKSADDFVVSTIKFIRIPEIQALNGAQATKIIQNFTR